MASFAQPGQGGGPPGQGGGGGGSTNCNAIALASGVFPDDERDPDTNAITYPGYRYDVIPDPGISWDRARAAAEECVLTIDIDEDGEQDDPDDLTVYGRLVTIETSEEFEFVEALRAEAQLNGELDAGEFWLGGFQADWSAEPTDTWMWLDGDRIPGEDNCVAGVTDSEFCDSVSLFANWAPDQPDDAPGSGRDGEMYLTLGFGSDDDGYSLDVAGFNDRSDRARRDIAGYIVAYTREPVANCQLRPGQGYDDALGCRFSGRGNRFVFPENVYVDTDEGALEPTVSYTRKLVLDPRAVVDQATGLVTCYGVDNPGAPPEALVLEDGKLTIPAYLCGSPYFEVIEARADNVDIREGAVFYAGTQLGDGSVDRAEFPQVYLNGGEDGPYTCNLEPGVDDIRRRHRAVWQTTDLRSADLGYPYAGSPDMLENLGFGGDPDNFFEGTGNPYFYPDPEIAGYERPSAGEFTAECGSTRLFTREKSYFVRGMHLQCSLDSVDWSNELSREPVVDCFAALAANKTSMLIQAIEKAIAAGVFEQEGDYQSMLNQAQTALSKLTEGNYTEADNHLRNLIDRLDRTVIFEDPTGFNHEGEIKMRAENVHFIVQEDILPNAP